jgi:hypothetical protein
MEKTGHQLDPDGDVVLVLQNQDTAFAFWDESLANPPAPFSPSSEAEEADCPPDPERELSDKGKRKLKKKLKNAKQRVASVTDFS